MSTSELERELISGLEGELSSELHCELDGLDESEDDDSSLSESDFSFSLSSSSSSSDGVLSPAAGAMSVCVELYVVKIKSVEDYVRNFALCIHILNCDIP